MGPANVHDPLRFGADDDQQDVPLDDGPPAPASPAGPSDPSGAPGAPLDPSGSASLSRPGSSSDLPAPELGHLAGIKRPGAARGTIDLQDSPEQFAGGPSAPAFGEPLARVKVSDPVKKSEESVIPGLSTAHTEYLITTTWRRDGRVTRVHRRFKEFVALADLLDYRNRGYFVYPRPDKATLEGQLGGGDLVKTRVLELERYLNHLVVHPVIGAGEELRVFLEAEGPLVQSLDWARLQPLRGGLLDGLSRLPRQLLGSDSSVPSTTEAVQNAKNTSDLIRRFRELSERVKHDFGNTQPTLSREEEALRERKADVETYAARLALASRKAEKLVQEFEDHGAAFGDFGMSLIKLANYEDQEGSKVGPFSDLASGAKAVAADARRIGAAAVRYRRLTRLGVSHLTEALAPLHDELALAPAATHALRERESALLTAHLIADDVRRKKEALALQQADLARHGGAGGRARRVETLDNEIAAAEAAHTAAQAEYERIKTRNLEELVRWGQDKQHDFKAMAYGFASVSQNFDARAHEILTDAVRS